MYYIKKKKGECNASLQLESEINDLWRVWNLWHHSTIPQFQSCTVHWNVHFDYWLGSSVCWMMFFYWTLIFVWLLTTIWCLGVATIKKPHSSGILLCRVVVGYEKTLLISMYVFSGLVMVQVLIFVGMIRRSEKSCKEGAFSIQCFP